MNNKEYTFLINEGYSVYPGYYNFVHGYPAMNKLPCINDKIAFNNSGKEIAVYIHIPFCSSMCKFCYYRKIQKPSKELVLSYLNSLEKEIVSFKDHTKKIQTIYIGGGSPSFLNIDEIELLFKVINKNIDTDLISEMTFEVEPSTITVDKLKCLKDNRVTRISIGMQSFNDEVLKYYNRDHKASENIRAINLISKQNFHTFNIDLIYGLINQDVEDVEKSLKFINEFKPPSITFYQLWYSSPVPKPNLTWGNKIRSLNPILEMKNIIYEALLEEYQINNQCWFVLNEKDKCKHYNFTWRNNSFLGFGASAYGFYDNYSYWNNPSVFDYINAIRGGSTPIKFAKQLSPCEIATRRLILGLKTNTGINIKKIENEYNLVFSDSINSKIHNLISNGFMEFKDDKLVFSKKGIFWGDSILSKFMEKEAFN